MSSLSPATAVAGIAIAIAIAVMENPLFSDETDDNSRLFI
jgi:hypothetical protein